MRKEQINGAPGPSVPSRSDTTKFNDHISVPTSWLLFFLPSPGNLELLKCQVFTREGHLWVDQRVVTVS